MNKKETNSNRHDMISVERYLLDIINARNEKYEQRFALIDNYLAETNDSVKQALITVTNNTKEALETANTNISAALLSLDKRFDAVNEFRGQLADAQLLFARKTDIDSVLIAYEKAQLKSEKTLEDRFHYVDELYKQLLSQQLSFARKDEITQAISSFKESVIKSETATEKRFDSVNEFRAQMQDMQDTLARKSEMDILFDSVNNKIDTALKFQQFETGKDLGLGIGWKIFIGAAGFLSIIIAILNIMNK